MNNDVLFEEKNVRRIWHNDRWYFSVVDTCAVLAETLEPMKFWSVLSAKMKAEDLICVQLKIQSSDGKFHETDCADVEGLLRIIQFIQSPKAEAFKSWLAKVGYEPAQEIKSLELTSDKKDFRSAFDMIPREYKDFKSMDSPSQNIHAQGFTRNNDVVNLGGKVTGDARNNINKPIGNKNNVLSIKAPKGRRKTGV